MSGRRVTTSTSAIRRMVVKKFARSDIWAGSSPPPGLCTTVSAPAASAATVRCDASPALLISTIGVGLAAEGQIAAVGQAIAVLADQ